MRQDNPQPLERWAAQEAVLGLKGALIQEALSGPGECLRKGSRVGMSVGYPSKLHSNGARKTYDLNSFRFLTYPGTCKICVM